MKLQGNLSLLSGGSILGARVENLASDPSSPYNGQIWYNTTDNVYKGFNGTDVIQFAVGGLLNNYVLKAGDTMTGTLTLSNGATVTGLAAPSANTDAATKKYVDDGLALKENNITGAATTITQSNLTASRAVVSDSNGKVDVSTATATEVGYLSGVTSAIQTQIDSKQPNITGAATTITSADLTASRLLQSDTNGKVSASTVTATEVGYLSGITSSVQTQIDAQVAASGDTMTGNLIMTTGTHITIPDVAVNGTDAVNLNTLQNFTVNLQWRNEVEARDNTSTTLPTGAAVVIDGYTVANGDRVLFTNLTAGNNVVYVAAGIGTAATWTAAKDFARTSADAQEGDTLLVQNGTVFALAAYTFNGTSWVQFNGGTQVMPGVGLTKTGNQLDISLGAGIQELPSDEVGIDLYSASGLMLTTDGSAASTATNAQLAVKLDGVSLARSANGVKVADAGVTESHLNTSVAGGGLVGGAGTALAVGAGTGITVNADDVAVDLTWADNRFINTSGDTMTGSLTLSGAPTTDLMAATKKYVDDADTALSTTLTGLINTLSSRVDAGYFLYTSSGSATSHTVTHNMGIKYPNVTVVDSTDQVILPQSITYDSTSALTVTFNSAIDCKVVVGGVKPVS